MAITLIIKCPKCANPLLAGKTQKTRTCPYCGVRVKVNFAKKIATADNAFHASEMLKRLKNKEGFG